MAAAFRDRGSGCGSRHYLVCAEDLRGDVLLPVGAGDAAAFPLRPTDAAGLESLSALHAALGGRDVRNAFDVRRAAKKRYGRANFNGIFLRYDLQRKASRTRQ